MAENTADYIQRTICGWFSGMFKGLAQFGGCLMIGTKMYCEMLCGGAEDYFNKTHDRLSDSTDVYVQTSFQNMTREHGGKVPCCFLELLVKEIVEITMAIAIDPRTKSSAVSGYERHMESVAEQIDEHWTARKAKWTHQMQLFEHCSDPANCASSCGGKLRNGAKQRFTLNLDVTTTPTRDNTKHKENKAEDEDGEGTRVRTNLHFASPNTSDACSFCFSSGATKRCGRCKSTRYCNGLCQRVHWDEHRKVCVSASNEVQK